ncbi:hypothetical protein Poly30_01380 [Planctomycetes bacterium Poly30]|uniref:YtkA-like domain-containing protein n=2 Tax=Saltatorellus ferox TaxID=2528018 RepID=A0A518EKM8_9BACT|nr:hypothetical protein Poly30_01380 [Planctomycetes bacterium Poly30]
MWLAAFSAFAPLALAHDGPPYPICVDEVMGSITLSIWADPDVGEGTFYYYLDPPTGDVQVEARALFRGAAETEVSAISVDPQARAPYQQIGTLPFEQQGPWTLTFSLMDGGKALGEIELDVDVTPPGMGRLYLVWYAIPFLAAVAIWLRIFLASRTYLLPAVPPSGDSPV